MTKEDILIESLQDVVKSAEILKGLTESSTKHLWLSDTSKDQLTKVLEDADLAINVAKKNIASHRREG